jgi:hypothetical protein
MDHAVILRDSGILCRVAEVLVCEQDASRRLIGALSAPSRHRLPPTLAIYGNHKLAAGSSRLGRQVRSSPGSPDHRVGIIDQGQPPDTDHAKGTMLTHLRPGEWLDPRGVRAPISPVEAEVPRSCNLALSNGLAAA